MRIAEWLKWSRGAVLLCAASAGLAAQQAGGVGEAKKPEDTLTPALRTSYVLGAGDVITVSVLDAEEIGDKPIRIGVGGNINLPMVGRLQAAGMTVEELEGEMVTRLNGYIKKPQVSVSIVEFRSQPVSVIGSVTSPGVIQLQGNKTLVEVLSLAGGVRPEAGHSVIITRKRQWGPIPLGNARPDPTGQFTIAEVNLKAVVGARNPEQNILIRPEDVISVPHAEVVYALGDVRKAGGFVLNDRETLSVLQILSLAEGLERTAAPGNARILRPAAGEAKRTEIAVDLKKIMAGEATDVALHPDDILFVPSSAGKKAGWRALEALLGMGTSIGTGSAIYRR
jgi:polysaccharide export outer membrane protein